MNGFTFSFATAVGCILSMDPWRASEPAAKKTQISSLTVNTFQNPTYA